MKRKFKTFALLATALVMGFTSCEKDLSDDGLAMRFDVVPGTNIKESQLESKTYTEAEFKELMDGRCYRRVAVYDCYKEWKDTYYVIMHEENGEYIFNALYGCDGCGRDIRLFKGDELMTWGGSIGYESTCLYNYSFDAARQKLVYNDNKEAVIFVNDEYLITLNNLFWSSSLDAGAMFSRTVYERTDKTDWHSNDTIDYRNLDF